MTGLVGNAIHYGSIAGPGPNNVFQFQFVSAWDQYLWPLVIMQSENKQVVQVGLSKLIDVEGQSNWGAVMAGAILALIPPMVVFTVLQEQFSKGFALGQDK